MTGDDRHLLPLLAIVGPTAVGKTDLALALAERFAVEAVSADSRQIYRYMDIGTAKPTAEERQRLVHHLVDIVDPDQALTLAEYQEAAIATIEAVLARGRLPLLVGGSGLYVWAVLENWQIPHVPPHSDVRQELEAEAARYGAAHLHALLAAVDAEAAATIHPANVRRVIRALEVQRLSGRPLSAQRGKGPPRWRQLVIGLTARRDQLYERADRRVDSMVERGLVAEVRDLLARGYATTLPAMSGLGYRQMAAHLQQGLPLAEAIRQTKTGTHRFIRQQNTWFRRDDARIRWLSAPPSTDEVVDLVQGWLNAPG